MKPRQQTDNKSTIEKVHSPSGSTSFISLSFPFTFSRKTAEAKLNASIERADQTIAKIDETRAQTQISMEKSDQVLAEVEANKKRFGCN